MNKKFVQLLDHIFKVMVHRSKVQGEEAVPKSDLDMLAILSRLSLAPPEMLRMIFPS